MLTAMQVPGSLIAAQAALADRQAQARFQAPVQSGGAAAAGTPSKASQPPSAPAMDGFAPLPLKQAPAQAPAEPVRPQGVARLGAHIDITV